LVVRSEKKEKKDLDVRKKVLTFAVRSARGGSGHRIWMFAEALSGGFGFFKEMIMELGGRSVPLGGQVGRPKDTDSCGSI